MLMKKRILMIDDDAHMRRMVAIYLKREPYELVSVGSARMALHELKKGPFDLILSDIQMPEMDGIELIKAIKSQYPQMPIIILSAFDAGKFQREMAAYEQLAILSKPFDQKSLLKLLERFLMKDDG